MAKTKSTEKTEELTEEIREKTENTVSDFLKLFFLAKDQLDKTKKTIEENSKTSFNYVMLTIFAVLVIMLGMIIDSTAVVIGGMLIAPLFWPILGFAIGITSGNIKTVSNSFLVLVKSLVLIFGVSIVLGIFAPEHILENAEFTSRTAPTIFDLLIGLLAGFLGAYIVSHPKMTSSFGGVVVAAALVPPIAVMGVALTKGDFDAFGGAFLLTIATLVSMTFSAALLFYIGRISGRSKKTFFNAQNIGWFLFALAIVIVPLLFLTNEIVDNERNQNLVNEIAINTFPDASLVETTISERNGISTVKLILHREDSVSEEKIREIAHVISEELDASVILDVTTVPISTKREIVNYR